MSGFPFTILHPTFVPVTWKTLLTLKPVVNLMLSDIVNSTEHSLRLWCLKKLLYKHLARINCMRFENVFKSHTTQANIKYCSSVLCRSLYYSILFEFALSCFLLFYSKSVVFIFQFYFWILIAGSCFSILFLYFAS